MKILRYSDVKKVGGGGYMTIHIQKLPENTIFNWEGIKDQL